MIMEQSSGGSRQSRRGGTRQQTHEIVIDAPIEAVWKAIVDGEELTRWFVEEATVEPGVGGTFTISWGGDEKGQSRIDEWEPNKKLRVTLMPFDMGPAKYDGTTPMVDEYTIQRRDGKTVLRLVSSGIPDVPEWNGFYNGTDSGWRSFFRTLKHYLEHHRGQPRTTIKVIGKLTGSLEEAWTRLRAAVEPLGTVVFEQAPTILEANIPEIGEAYLAHSMSSAGGSNYVYTIVSVFGKTPAEVEAIRAKWQPWLEQVLGVESPGHAGH
jgi:uncharacterized protein YndB with AHSA1/START domain